MTGSEAGEYDQRLGLVDGDMLVVVQFWRLLREAWGYNIVGGVVVNAEPVAESRISNSLTKKDLEII